MNALSNKSINATNKSIIDGKQTMHYRELFNKALLTEDPKEIASVVLDFISEYDSLDYNSLTKDEFHQYDNTLAEIMQEVRRRIKAKDEEFISGLWDNELYVNLDLIRDSVLSATNYLSCIGIKEINIAVEFYTRTSLMLTDFLERFTMIKYNKPLNEDNYLLTPEELDLMDTILERQTEFTSQIYHLTRESTGQETKEEIESLRNKVAKMTGRHTLKGEDLEAYRSILGIIEASRKYYPKIKTSEDKIAELFGKFGKTFNKWKNENSYRCDEIVHAFSDEDLLRYKRKFEKAFIK